MEISLDALLGVQRHGQDLAYRLAQGVSGLLLHVQPPQHPWPAPPLPLKLIPFDIELLAVPFVGGGGVDLPAVAVASFVEIGGRLGQAGSDLGGSIGGVVQQLSRQIPVSFRAEGARRRNWEGATASPTPAALHEGEAGLAAERAAEGCGVALEGVGERDSLEEVVAAVAAATGSAVAASAVGVRADGADGSDEDEDGFEFEIGTLGRFMKPQIYDGFLYRFRV
ncbi:uncharacterized protein LOC123407327 [Hordeum vulgare subsp. vulgare]|uniref:uncharacterized protein LOC123407327 n=1 Tax=Hordeum vulgare subsp. vulgare TaxID=112509 RepID=UPI001D1A5232|nr:uncharacterized protein LOC123407327 [Hordeum vulgare subsp. vulgare]